MARKQKNKQSIEADLVALRSFLEEQVEGYASAVRTVDLSGVQADSMRVFWEHLGYHPKLKEQLYPPDGVKNAEKLIKGLGLEPGRMPAQYTILYQDHFSVWYTDDTQGQDDPPVLVWNDNMDAPVVASSGFLRYATYQVVMMALERWLSVEVETSPALQGKPLFPALHPDILQHDDLLLVPFDDADNVEDRRVMVHAAALHDLWSIPWESQTTTLLWGFECRDEAYTPKKRTEILVTGLSLKVLADARAFEVQDEEETWQIWLGGLEAHPAWIMRDIGEWGDEEEFTILCEPDARKDYIAWSEKHGAKVLRINGRKYKPR